MVMTKNKIKPNKLGELLKMISTMYKDKYSQEVFLPTFLNSITNDLFESKKYNSLMEKQKISDFLNEQRRFPPNIAVELHRTLVSEKLRKEIYEYMSEDKDILEKLSAKLKKNFNLPDSRPKLTKTNMTNFLCDIFLIVLENHIIKKYD